MKISYQYILLAMLGFSCQATKDTATSKVQLITLDPGHFHAALVQKSMYDDVDTVVHVYAPEGNELQQHLEKIDGYNKSADNPTRWNEVVYKGNDFLEKMLQEKRGNVVVIAGNNRNKTEYIKRSVEAGFNVLADKPMVINKANFEVLKNVFSTATEKKVLLYDIMTERFEITNMLQKEFAMIPEIFGTLQDGSADKPAVEMESVHYFFKNVSGKILIRPTWFMDMSQQGEAIVDVATHLVDLAQWQCFPEVALDTKDIQMISSRRWSTDLTLTQFKDITKADTFPSSLKKDIAEDSSLKVYANGEINYALRGKHIKLIAKWDYQAPTGMGDTHYSLFRGTKANLVIRQGAEEKGKPTLYIEPVNNDAAFENILKDKIKTIDGKFPGVTFSKTASGFEIIIPEKYKEGHEAHFARVTEKFLEYLKQGNIPSWEVPNILAKYFTTTEALELAKKSNPHQVK